MEIKPTMTGGTRTVNLSAITHTCSPQRPANRSHRITRSVAESARKIARLRFDRNRRPAPLSRRFTRNVQPLLPGRRTLRRGGDGGPCCTAGRSRVTSSRPPLRQLRDLPPLRLRTAAAAPLDLDENLHGALVISIPKPEFRPQVTRLRTRPKDRTCIRESINESPCPACLRDRPRAGRAIEAGPYTGGHCRRWRLCRRSWLSRALPPMDIESIVWRGPHYMGKIVVPTPSQKPDKLLRKSTHHQANCYSEANLQTSGAPDGRLSGVTIPRKVGRKGLPGRPQVEKFPTARACLRVDDYDAMTRQAYRKGCRSKKQYRFQDGAGNSVGPPCRQRAAIECLND